MRLIKLALALAVVLVALAGSARAGMNIAVGIDDNHRGTLLVGAAPGLTLGNTGTTNHGPIAVAVLGDYSAMLSGAGELALFVDGVEVWSVVGVNSSANSKMAFSADGLSLVISEGESLLVHSTETGDPLYSRNVGSLITGLATYHGVRSSGIGPGGSITVVDPVVVHAGNNILFYSTGTNRVVDSISATEGEGLAIDGEGVAWFISAGSRLASVSLRTDAVTLSPAGTVFQTPVGPSPDGTRVAAGGASPGGIIVWSPIDKAIVRTFDLFQNVNGVVMPDKNSLIAVTDRPDSMGRSLAEVSIPTGTRTFFTPGRVMAMAGSWEAEGSFTSPLLNVAVSSRASQTSVNAMRSVVDDVNAKVNANLDAKVSSRATQSSVDGLASSINSRATQSSVDALAGGVASRASQGSVDGLAGSINTRATQASVDALGTSVDSRASQSSVDALPSQIATRASQSSVDGLSTDIASRASQSSVDGLSTDIATRASQSSVDALGASVDSRASQSSVDALTGNINTRATQASVDALVVSLDGRASQASLDALAADELARSQSDAEEHAEIVARVDGFSRQQIEQALAAGAIQPLFLIPAGPDGDPAVAHLTCPSLPPAGMTAVDADGLFEVVRCVTRRSLDDLRAIGEDVTRAEREFADGEADRMAVPPRHRSAVENYAAAIQLAARGR